MSAAAIFQRKKRFQQNKIKFEVNMMKMLAKSKENQVNLLKEVEVAEILQISPVTLRKYVRYAGKIKFVKWNGTVRYLLSDVTDFIARNRQPKRVS